MQKKIETKKTRGEQPKPEEFFKANCYVCRYNKEKNKEVRFCMYCTPTDAYVGSRLPVKGICQGCKHIRFFRTPFSICSTCVWRSESNRLTMYNRDKRKRPND